jgi:hypothetical protein
VFVTVDPLTPLIWPDLGGQVDREKVDLARRLGVVRGRYPGLFYALRRIVEIAVEVRRRIRGARPLRP